MNLLKWIRKILNVRERKAAAFRYETDHSESDFRDETKSPDTDSRNVSDRTEILTKRNGGEEAERFIPEERRLRPLIRILVLLVLCFGFSDFQGVSECVWASSVNTALTFVTGADSYEGTVPVFSEIPQVSLQVWDEDSGIASVELSVNGSTVYQESGISEGGVTDRFTGELYLNGIGEGSFTAILTAISVSGERSEKSLSGIFHLREVSDISVDNSKESSLDNKTEDRASENTGNQENAYGTTREGKTDTQTLAAGDTETAGQTADRQAALSDQAPPVCKILINGENQETPLYLNQPVSLKILAAEQNFSAELMSVKIYRNGNEIKAKEAGIWNAADDLKSEFQEEMSILLDENGSYKIVVSGTDTCGNKMEEISCGPFVIDKDAPELAVFNIKPGQVYHEEIFPEIGYIDENPKEESLFISCTGARCGEVPMEARIKENTESTESLVEAGEKDRINGVFLIQPVNGKWEDDWYTLTFRFKDLAGNETEYQIPFAINKNGSDFTPANTWTGEILEGWEGMTFYAEETESDDFSFYDENPESPVRQKLIILKNGEVLDLSGTKFQPRIVTKKEDDGWWVSQVTIPKEVFREKAVFKIIYVSEDEGGHMTDLTGRGKNAEFTIEEAVGESKDDADDAGNGDGKMESILTESTSGSAKSVLRSEIKTDQLPYMIGIGLIVCAVFGCLTVLRNLNDKPVRQERISGMFVRFSALKKEEGKVRKPPERYGDDLLTEKLEIK